MRADVVRVARSYLGTPYGHMGRQPGVVLDCAGVLICVARELGLKLSDFDVPNYLPQPDGYSLLRLCDEHLGPRVPSEKMLPGHAIVVKPGARPQHLALLGDYLHGGLSIIHAANNAHPPRVIETRLMFSALLRFVAAYEMPGAA